MSKYGVTHRLATAYHPQTSGQVEVSNRGQFLYDVDEGLMFTIIILAKLGKYESTFIPQAVDCVSHLPDLGEITYAFDNLIMNEIFESAFDKKFPGLQYYRFLNEVLINCTSMEGAMERRATMLPRFAKKSTSSWLKGALQAYACSCARISGGRILLLSFASVVSAARSDSTETR
ncbi:reverse transcriptase domain-containing protein [Tanacetum coccineum]